MFSVVGISANVNMGKAVSKKSPYCLKNQVSAQHIHRWILFENIQLETKENSDRPECGKRSSNFSSCPINFSS